MNCLAITNDAVKLHRQRFTNTGQQHREHYLAVYVAVCFNLTLRVNTSKTKVMYCKVRSGQIEDSGRFPCAECRKGVGVNSIACARCGDWVHKRCSGLKCSLNTVVGFECRRCVEGTGHEEVKREIEIEHVGKLECVDKFCYLGDMIGAGGGAEEASTARVRWAWGKFRELSPILTSRGASIKMKGKLYSARVQSAMIYGSETWAMKVEDMQRLGRTERMMVRWMCEVILKDRKSSED